MAHLSAKYPGYAVLPAPVMLRGPVTTGFNRGSSELGIPTANLDAKLLEEPLKSLESGIYAGWAQVGTSPVYPCCLSIGWNPFFKDVKEKTVEPHIMHEFAEPFYGADLRVLVCAYLRPELDFDGLDNLIRTIREDIEFSGHSLNLPELARARLHDGFAAVEEEESKDESKDGEAPAVKGSL